MCRILLSTKQVNILPFLIDNWLIKYQYILHIFTSLWGLGVEFSTIPRWVFRYLYAEFFKHNANINFISFILYRIRTHAYLLIVWSWIIFLLYPIIYRFIVNPLSNVNKGFRIWKFWHHSFASPYILILCRWFSQQYFITYLKNNYIKFEPDSTEFQFFAHIHILAN